MAPSHRSAPSAELHCAGEVWTDGRGRATVKLPWAARPPGTRLRYELRPSDARIGARVVAELLDGRFTIETDEPHVRIAWRAHAATDGVECRPPGKEM